MDLWDLYWLSSMLHEAGESPDEGFAEEKRQLIRGDLAVAA